MVKKGKQEFKRDVAKSIYRQQLWSQFYCGVRLRLSSLSIITPREQSYRIYGQVEASKALTNGPDEGRRSRHFNSGGKSVSPFFSSSWGKYVCWLCALDNKISQKKHCKVERFCAHENLERFRFQRMSYCIILSASLTMSQPIRLNLTNTVHLHYTCQMQSALLLLDLTVKKILDLQFQSNY